MALAKFLAGKSITGNISDELSVEEARRYAESIMGAAREPLDYLGLWLIRSMPPRYWRLCPFNFATVHAFRIGPCYVYIGSSGILSPNNKAGNSPMKGIDYTHIK